MTALPQLSPSLRGAWRACGRKVFFRYVAGIEPIKRGKALGIGTATHAGLETYRRTLDIRKALAASSDAWLREMNRTGVDADEGQTIVDQIKAYVSGYLQHFGETHQTTSLVEVQAFDEGDGETGYLDSLVKYPDGTLWIVEDKTTARFVDSDLQQMALQLNDQVVTYVLALAERGIIVEGVKYRQILKTMTRRNKNENAKEYALRVMGLYVNDAEDKFREFEVRFTQAELVAWASHKARENMDVRQWLASKASLESWPFNCGNCIGPYGPCEYLKLCSRGVDAAQREFKPNGKEPLDNGSYQAKIWRSDSNNNLTVAERGVRSEDDVLFGQDGARPSANG